MTEQQNRRQFLKTTGAALAATGLAASGLLRSARAAVPPIAGGEHSGRIYKSIKFGMFREKLSYQEKFRLLKDMGYDGVEREGPLLGDDLQVVAFARRVPVRGRALDLGHVERIADPQDPGILRCGEAYGR